MYENLRVALKDGRFIVQYSLLNSLLVKDLEIPIFVEKQFTVQCCIRGYHTYQAQWNAEVGAKLNTAPDTRPAALVEDKYTIAVKHDEQTVGHVPKFLSKLTFFFFLKHGGKVIIKVNGPKRYSVDLKQGGMEVPAEFCFETCNEKLFFQMKEKTLVEIEKFEEKRKQMEEEKKKKKKPKTDKKKLDK